MVAASIVSPSAAQTAGSVDELRRQIDAQQRQIQQQNETLRRLETQMAQTAPAAKPADAKYITEGDFPGSWKIPSTGLSVKIGGFISMDATYDTGGYGAGAGASQGNGPSLVTSGIPMNHTNAAGLNGSFTMTARRSRLTTDVRANTEMGLARAYFEFDMAGGVGNANENQTNSYFFRMRKLYIDLGSLRVGQAESIGWDGDAAPDTVDWQGPGALAFVTRQAQIRWTQQIGSDLKFQVGIENPESNLDQLAAAGNANAGVNATAGGNQSGFNLDHYPDLVGAVRYQGTGNSWHVNLAGLLSNVNADIGPNLGQLSDKGKWGYLVSGTGHVNLPVLNPGTKFMAGGSVGYGTARYMNDGAASGFRSAFLDQGTVNSAGANGAGFPTAGRDALTLIPFWAAYAAVEAWWAPTLHSTFTGGYVNIDNTRFQPAGSMNSSTYSAVNLIWNPVKWVSTGIEYLYGSRTDNKFVSNNSSNFLYNGNLPSHQNRAFGSDQRIHGNMKLSF